MGLAGPTHDDRSWSFDLDPGGVDPVLGYERLQEAYLARFADYSRGITVPTWSTSRRRQRSPTTSRRSRTTSSSSGVTTTDPMRPDLWPDECREEMEDVMERVYEEVNDGVYRCGFAGSQEAYDAAYDRLWAAMDWLEDRLSQRRYLMGDRITEADVRLFTTLARFDAVYHGHFKCNRNKLTEMPALWGYARDLFQTPGSARPSTSTRSSGTTTSSTRTSTPTRSFLGARTPPAGPRRTGASGSEPVRRLRAGANGQSAMSSSACAARRRREPRGAVARAPSHAHHLARRSPRGSRPRTPSCARTCGGYGRSTLPPDAPDHAQSSKRAMARDVVELMTRHGTSASGGGARPAARWWR